MIARRDFAVIGSGPNGLAAAIRMAQEGREGIVFEAASVPGGSVRSAELTLPSFVHDQFSAVFPIAVASPFFKQLDLQRYGLRWIHPAAPLAHPLDDGTAVLLLRSAKETAAQLGTDGEVYLELMEPLIEHAESFTAGLLAPPGLPPQPLSFASFGLQAIRSATGFACSHFHGDDARALFAGCAAHSFLDLESPMTAGFGLFLALLGHGVGWPIPEGGSGSLSSALLALLDDIGGVVKTESQITSLEMLPPARVVFFDTDPRQTAAIAGSRFPPSYRRRLRRHRYGPGVFKLDYALSAPVPWTAVDCLRAGTVHLGGSLEEIALSEKQATQGQAPEHPFVLISQPSLFDPTRAPSGNHTLWAYCHVPAGSRVDMTERIERQIERFAPGFREFVLARHVMNPNDLEEANANLVGGAINGGVQDLRTYLGWALTRPSPYATPDPALFRCSSATPPGGGVHGMAGFHAAQFALSHGN
jgi:phytoene dehydrogenase-like protein